MTGRTDLALELTESEKYPEDGVLIEKSGSGDVSITKIEIVSEEGEKALGKAMGRYITVEFPPVTRIADCKELEKSLAKTLAGLFPDKKAPLLVAGLGNTDITPDAVGPLTAGRLLATRHINGQFAKELGLDGIRSVSVLSPGVLGQTGIEASELIKAAVSAVKPAAVIVIDALAARSTERLFTTVQICDTGISPGSGVKNRRKELSSATLSVPVIAVGVPTVVGAEILAEELTGSKSRSSEGMFVTPKDVDMLTDRISGILARAMNAFLQPGIEPDILSGLV